MQKLGTKKKLYFYECINVTSQGRLQRDNVERDSHSRQANNLQDSRHANNLQDAHICTPLREKYLIALVCVIYLSLDIITKALVVQNLILKISFSQKC